MDIRFLRWGGMAALLAVALGAFGAHGLKQVVDAAAVTIFDTGVRYQFYHALALLLLGLLVSPRASRRLVYAGYCFLAGIVFFSGSLYLLAIQDWLGVSLRWLGPVTPLGGLLFIIGWVLFILSIRTINNEVHSEH